MPINANEANFHSSLSYLKKKQKEKIPNYKKTPSSCCRGGLLAYK